MDADLGRLIGRVCRLRPDARERSSDVITRRQDVNHNQTDPERAADFMTPGFRACVC